MAAGPMDGTHHLESVAADWWQELGSARLNALIAQALQSSPNLAATEATLRQADRMYAAQAGATQSPQVDARLGAQRQQSNAAASGMPDGDRLYNLYHVGVEVGYTFDLFGANRRFLEKLAAEVDYQRYQHDGARLALVGNVVTTAITQARLVARLKSSEAILADQEARDLAKKTDFGGGLPKRGPRLADPGRSHTCRRSSIACGARPEPPSAGCARGPGTGIHGPGRSISVVGVCSAGCSTGSLAGRPRAPATGHQGSRSHASVGVRTTWHGRRQILSANHTQRQPGFAILDHGQPL